MALTNPPASWDALAGALQAINSKAVVRAIVVQLEFTQPSAEVYNFLNRTLNLAIQCKDAFKETEN